MDQLASDQGKGNYPEFYVYLVGADKSLNAKCNKGILLTLLSLILINDIGSSVSLTVAYMWHLLTLPLRRNEWAARVMRSVLHVNAMNSDEMFCSVISSVIMCMSYEKENLWGAWVAQLGKRPTLDFSSCRGLTVREIEPHVWVWADSVEPALGFSLSLSLSLPHLHRLALSL